MRRVGLTLQTRGTVTSDQDRLIDVAARDSQTNRTCAIHLDDCPCRNRSLERRRALAARVSSAIKSALAGVGEGPKDCAGVLVHDLTKVHGDGEQEDQEEKVDAKQ